MCGERCQIQPKSQVTGTGTLGQSVVSVGDSNLVMPNYNHEEADTRDVVHIRYALEQGLNKIEVHTADTDDFVILATIC